MVITDTDVPVRHARMLWNPIVSLIEQHDRFVLSTHENSDGDGLGSQCALAGVLSQLGKEVSILNPTVVPKNYLFLPFLSNAEIFAETYEGHRTLLNHADVFFLLDTNRISRTRGIAPLVKERRDSGELRVVCIDHHLDPEDFADFLLCQSYAAATGELIYELIKALEVHYDTPLITPEVATGLYTAIMTDTASFKLPKTTPHLHRAVAELLETGISPMGIYEQIYHTLSTGVLQLLGRALQDVVQLHHGKIAYVAIRQSLLTQTGTLLSDSERLTDYLMALPETELGILMIELPNGKTKVSFRSKGPIAVNLLAGRYGGGGHKNAAGCTASLTIDEAITRLPEEAALLIPNEFSF